MSSSSCMRTEPISAQRRGTRMPVFGTPLGRLIRDLCQLVCIAPLMPFALRTTSLRPVRVAQREEQRRWTHKTAAR